MPTIDELSNGFVIGDWTVQPNRRSLQCGDETIVPEPKVFSALLSLARRNGDIVTRDDFANEVWEGRPVGDEPINRVISVLRRHLHDTKPYRYIELVPREGYRLKEPAKLLGTLVPNASPVANVVPAIQARRWSARWIYASVGILIGIGIASLFWSGTSPAHSIAVMPVENISGDASNDYLGSGLKAELLQTLYRVPEISVKNSRLPFDQQPMENVRKKLKVDFLLNGQLNRDGDRLVIYFNLVGKDGFVTQLDSVEGRIEDIFDLQKRLAANVSAALLGNLAPTLIKTRSPALSTAAYDRYMRALYSFERRGDVGRLEQAIGLFEESVRLDPSFGPAHLLLAQSFALAPVYMDEAVPEEMHRRAISTVERGIQEDRSIRDPAATVYGYVFHKQKRWVDSEREFIRATTADVLDSNAFNLYSQMLASVGRLDASLEYARMAYEIDPTSTVIASRVALAATWVNDPVLATEFFARSAELGDAGVTHTLGEALFYLREQRIEEALDKAQSSAEQEGHSQDWIAPVFTALLDPAQHDLGLAAIDEATANKDVGYQVEFFVRVNLGDMDGAMRIARLLLQEGEVFEMDILWIPEMRAFRETEGFLELVSALGITDYWAERGCAFVDDSVTCGNTAAIEDRN